MNSRRNYFLLLAGQFLGAFGDNAILAVIVGQLTYLQQAGSISESQLRSTSALYTGLLFVPYVLLAPLAGYLNDRYGKVRWLVGGNGLKVLGACVCAAGTWGGFWLQGLGYLIVGVGSCVYGPAKYGILPEILPRERLVKANGTVELLTLVAILGGAVGGSWLSDVNRNSVLTSFVVLIAIFLSAMALNAFMRPTPNDPSVRFSSSLGAFNGHVRSLFTTGRLGRVLIGTALFWVCGAAMKINFQPWGLQVLGLSTNTEIAALGLWLSVGVMIGSVLAGQLHKVGDLSGVRRYGFALAASFGALYLVRPGSFWLSPVIHLSALHVAVPITLLLVVAGMAAGLFLIPLNAALQAESDPAKLGKTIAAQNLCDNLGMILAAAYVFTAAKVGLSSSGVFLGLGVGTAIACLLFGFRKASSSTPPRP